jgi:hypothetical protein
MELSSCNDSGSYSDGTLGLTNWRNTRSGLFGHENISESERTRRRKLRSNINSFWLCLVCRSAIFLIFRVAARPLWNVDSSTRFKSSSKFSSFECFLHNNRSARRGITEYYLPIPHPPDTVPSWNEVRPNTVASVTTQPG